MDVIQAIESRISCRAFTGQQVEREKFDALVAEAARINEETGLPEVDEEKCTSCGACVKACPRHIIELRKRGPKSRRVYVRCVNKDKGAVAKKNCLAACIGCGKCAKECKFEAITVTANLSYIDPEKCRLCRKCEAVCPTGSIIALNFPPRKEKPAEPKAIPSTTAAPAGAPETAKPVVENVKKNINTEKEDKA